MRMDQGTSSAWRACELRGRARNEIPNAFAKQVRASTPVRASIAAAIGSISFSNTVGKLKTEEEALEDQPLADESIGGR